LLDNLQKSRLLTPAQLAVAADQVKEEQPTHVALKGLVTAGLLTEFQARRVWSGRTEGLVLGQYRVLDELGRGGFGQVYKARHTVMDRIVALKVIAPELVADERARSWFLREVQTLTQLFHPNIAMAFDAHQDEDALFLVMEFIDGPNLDTLVQKQGPLPVTVACEMMRQAGQALQYAHEKGMVHRDIKPGNLLIPRDACSAGSWRVQNSQSATDPGAVLVKIVDFGLARLQGNSKSATLMVGNDSSFLGTPDYVSPEQARNVHAVDIRSDLYSLGCTFYFALTGVRPFKSATALETVVKHLEKEAEPIQSLRPEVPAAVAAVVARLMAKSPAKRFQTPADMVAELDFLCGKSQGQSKDARKAVRPKPVPAAPLMPVVMTTVRPALAPQTQAAASRSLLAEPVMADATQPITSWTPNDVSEATPRPAPRPVVKSVASNKVTAAAAAEVEPAGAEVLEVPATQAPEPLGTPAELRKTWVQWLALVESCARGHPIRYDEQSYRVLHRSLLEMCRSRIDPDDSAAEVYRQLENTLEPWVSPTAFHAADETALTTLVSRCRQLDYALRGKRRGKGIILLLVALVLGLITSVVGYQWAQSSTPSLPKISLAALWRIVQTNPILAAAIGVPLAIIFAIGFVYWWFRG
jgi:serine/threonine-protein kinase